MPSDNLRALPRQPEDNFTDVVIRVPDRMMAESWTDLERPMKDSPEYSIMCEMREDGHGLGFDETDLRLLAGAFGAVTAYLPMGPYEYIRWVDRWDEKQSSRQYVNGFLGDRLVDAPPLRELTNEQLDALVARISEFKVERARAYEEEQARVRETERCKTADTGSKQAAVELALAGAGIGDVWNAVANTFEGEELNEIGTNLYMHVVHLGELAAAVEAA